LGLYSKPLQRHIYTGRQWRSGYTCTFVLRQIRGSIGLSLNARTVHSFKISNSNLGLEKNVNHVKQCTLPKRYLDKLYYIRKGNSRSRKRHFYFAFLWIDSHDKSYDYNLFNKKLLVTACPIIDMIWHFGNKTRVLQKQPVVFANDRSLVELLL